MTDSDVLASLVGPLESEQERPFVHLFETVKCRYAFDVGSLDLVELGPLQFEVLNYWDYDRAPSATKVVSSRTEWEAAKAKIKELSEKGGIFSRRCPICVASAYDEALISRKLSDSCEHLCLNVSEQCNLRCSYCGYTAGRAGERRHSQRMMGWRTAKAAIDFFVTRSDATMRGYLDGKGRLDPKRFVPKPSVGFYGGEPLTNWPLVKRCVEYLRSLPLGSEYLVNMTTNGTMLRPGIVDLLVQHGVVVSVSMDGPREYHDRYRRDRSGKGTYDVVCARLADIRRRYPGYYNDSVTLLGVVAPPANWRRLMEFYVAFELLPGAGMRFNACEYGDPPAFWEALDPLYTSGDEDIWEEYKSMALSGRLRSDYVPGSEAEARKIRLLKQTWDLTLSHAFLRYERAPEGYAPGGVYRTNFGMCIPDQCRLFVTVDGNLLPCERVPSCASDYVIGTVESGFDLTAVNRICQTNATIVKDQCACCWNIRTCSLGCSKLIGEGGKLTPEARKAACAIAKRNTERSLALMCAILENDPEALDHLGSYSAAK